MNTFLIYAIGAFAALVSFFLIFYMDRHTNGWMRKGTALLALLTYFWVWFRDTTAIGSTVRLTGSSPFGDNAALTGVVLIVLWCSCAISLFTAMYPFSPLGDVRRILRYIGAPLSLIQVAMAPWLVKAVAGDDFGTKNVIRAVCLCLYVGLTLALNLLTWFDKSERKPGAWNRLRFLGWFAGALLVSFPAYLPRALFGDRGPSVRVIDLNPNHRIVLYIGILLAVSIFLAFRRQSREAIHFGLVFIALATMTTFMVDFSIQTYLNESFWPLALPLHLCNTAMFLIPLCLIFRIKSIYYFTFFINVIGAFFAMTMPNYNEGTDLFAVSMIVFWVNHITACLFPIVIMALGEFERPKLKHFRASMVVFAVYFLTVLICNAWFSNYGESDFFFINSTFITDKLGSWAERTRDVVASFSLGGLTFTFYPLYQVLFFLFYIAFTFCIWFLYEQCFTVADLYADMARRTQKIKLDRLALESELDGRSPEEPLNMELTDTLVLKNVTKRYGTSNVYAVKDANLEVKGGQIFGFLGPNGAGKSTIIKSIVGIQPITEGQIFVCGYDAMRQPVQAKRQLGFVPDHYELYENLTGREYINYMADLYRVSKEDRDERIKEYVTLFELTGSFDNPMKTYSHGMKQKIAIMAALVHDPRIWILDEPLTGLDPDSIFQVKECMRRHAARGNIVFFSSHIIDVVENLCDHIAIIRKGHILCHRTMEEVKSQMKLEDFYMKMIRGEITPDGGEIPMDATPVKSEKQKAEAQG